MKKSFLILAAGLVAGIANGQEARKSVLFNYNNLIINPQRSSPQKSYYLILFYSNIFHSLPSSGRVYL